jgi:hypothetical protein
MRREEGVGKELWSWISALIRWAASTVEEVKAPARAETAAACSDGDA